MSIILAYHYPCLDGAYALTSAYLFFREAKHNSISAKDFIEYISLFPDYQSIDKTIFEWKGKQPKEEKPIVEETKTASNIASSIFSSLFGCYAEQLQDILFRPTKISSDGKFDFPFSFGNEDHKKSVLIFLDYSGGQPTCLQKACQDYAKVIVIDHHLTFEKNLEGLSEAKEMPKNLLYLYKKSKSGATLTLEFFEKILGTSLIQDQQKYKNYLEALKYVEDMDLHNEKVSFSEEFSCGIYKRNLNFNANENLLLFDSLIEVNTDEVIESGKKELKNQRKKARKLLQTKHLIYLGGRTLEQKGKYGICYGVDVGKDQVLRNEVANELSLVSIKAGLENMGFAYSRTWEGVIRVSVRSMKGYPGGDCEFLARQYNGGGHYNAAGFHLSPSEFSNWKI